MCLYPGGYSLLNIGVWCKLLASQMLLKGCKEMEITGLQLGTVERMVHNFAAIVL
jgi:hypothetical protein